MFSLAADASAQSVEIALSIVGDAKNAPDPATGFGNVDYEYAIGTYDITVDQYTAFLNAVAAKTDKYRLYSPKMGKAGNFKNPNTTDSDFHTNAGIKRSGDSGNYSYSVIGDSGSEPVTYVSWFDAVRFCNWLHNGQPKGLGEVAGSTETGAYTLQGDRRHQTATKNAGAKWWISSENEWYKAAYYDPQLNGGRGGYWRYTTKSNDAPGNEIGDKPNQANYIVNARFSINSAGSKASQLTKVGAFSKSASPYGTFDQGGNVAQWIDSLIPQKPAGMRGGCYNGFADGLQSSSHAYPEPSEKSGYVGFRVATLPQR